jgi:hypothetical protein
MKMRSAVVACVLAILSGCLSFGGEQENDISTAGAAYTQQTATLIDEAIKSASHSDSESMLFMKVPESMLGSAEFSDEAMKSRLDASNTGLVDNAEKAFRLKASLDVVNAYFIGLQDLVRDPTADRNAMAVENLATQVNGMNRALEGGRGGGPVISREKRDALVQLTRVISDQIHARKVKKAVKRDAEVIATALYLQAELLDWAEMNIFRDLTSMTNRFYVAKVEVPYAKQSADMNEKWVENRTLYLKTKAFIQDYESRKAARDQSMLQIDLWSSALSGQYDQSIISQQIKDIRQIIAVKAEIKTASLDD